ncbi:MAG: biotin--[acetyl-CoA-carboxylase] ligase [Spirochaetaceae bacterium]|jgi:BirA family biotin operon repressor/biotin-[acetyl-CoA-carboxylase] ligase|nr:biotin--[acetyl-CoA-carboxylase] ligase [Spirochaetaceae bacterium]
MNPFNAPVYHVPVCASTMDVARSVEKDGAPHGTVVAADFQSAGRGRTARRVWESRAAENLLCTVILRYGQFSAIPPAFSLQAGLAVCCAIEQFAPALAGKLAIKWPNDVMISGRKTAGILVESDGTCVFAGIGVNVAQTVFAGAPHATSIVNEAGAGVLDGYSGGGASSGGGDSSGGGWEGSARRALLAIILERLFYGLRTDDSFIDQVRARLYLRGERVCFAAGGADGAPSGAREVYGVLDGIGRGGELRILRDGAREPECFVTGEIRLRGDAYTCRI